MKKIVSEIARSKANGILTPEQEAAYAIMDESFDKALAEEGVERKKQIDAVIEMIGTLEDGKSVASVIRNIAQKVDDVEARSTRKLSDIEKMSVKRALEGKKDEILKVMRKEQLTPWGLEFSAKRAASAMMTTGTVLTGAVGVNTDNYFDDVDVTVIRYPKNFIGDAINSRQVTKVPSVLRWKEQVVAGDGDAAVVAEGTTKPLLDYAFTWKSADRVKYAGHIEMTEEVEIDFEQLVLDIIAMFEEQVLRKYNDGLLAAIVAWAPVYAGTALDLTLIKPSLKNVVSAGQLQLQLAEYIGDVLIVNPADYAETQNMQNINGDPIMMPDSVLFPGIRVFVSSKMTAGTALLGDSAIVKEQHGAFILRSGVYGTQFIENEKTIVGEIFSVIKLPTESKKGWVKLNIATVKEALTKLA